MTPKRIRIVLLPLCVPLAMACAVLPTRSADPARPPSAPKTGTPTEPQAADALPREPPPTVWSWQSPLADDAREPRVQEMVRVRSERGTAADTADRVCDEILRRGLHPGEVCILLQNFGMGDGDPDEVRFPTRAPALFRHWCDGLPHPVALGQERCESIGSANASDWWMTPWMSHGIRECRAWTREFVDRYRARQAANPRIPDPDRFHFDTERGIMPQFNANGATQAFAAMRSDSRFGKEPIPGHGGRSLAHLYARAGYPVCDSTRPFYDRTNRAWTSWYAGVCHTAEDAAMAEAAYTTIRSTWSGCRTSNYETSASADGGGMPPRVSRGRRNNWFTWTHRGSADFQAPALYWADARELRPGETVQQASVRTAAERLSVHVGSADRWGTIVPWIQPVGSRPMNDDRGLVVDAEMFRDLLAVLRAYGISEFILWSDRSTQSPRHWDATRKAIRAAFLARLNTVSVERGDITSGNASSARFAGIDPLVVQAVRGPGDADYGVSIRLAFRSDAVRPAETLRLALSTWADESAAEVQVRVGDHAVAVPASGDPARDRPARILDLGPRPPTSGETIAVHLTGRAEVPFRLSLDGVTLYASRP